MGLFWRADGNLFQKEVRWNIYSSILNVPIALTELELWSIKNEFKEIEIVKLIDSDREYKLLVDGALNKR